LATEQEIPANWIEINMYFIEALLMPCSMIWIDIIEDLVVWIDG
jgi:hypothetical protein